METPMNTSAFDRSYMVYAPGLSNPAQTKDHHFERLGFKPADPSKIMRDCLYSDLEAHLTCPAHKFLGRATNPEAFRIMVLEFLAKYGPTYWGDTKRDHLEEPNSLLGFLCPRDAQRENSRLVEVLESWFSLRARQKAKVWKREKNSKKINTKASTGRQADVIGRPGVHKSRKSIERGSILREIEDEQIEDRCFVDGDGLTETPKRRRRCLDDGEQLKGSQTQDSDPTDSYTGAASRKPLIPDRDTEAFASYKTPYPRVPATLTSAPETKRPFTAISIHSDDSDAGEERGKEKPAISFSNSLIEKDKRLVAEKGRGFEDIKMEPLTDDMMRKTMFLVTVHDSTIGPVPVPFTECGSFTLLFPVLIQEQGVPKEDARKIDRITAIFSWTGGEYGGRVGGIRRDRPGDWVYFCENLRRAHETDADRFKGKCEVAMKLHVNERFGERY